MNKELLAISRRAGTIDKVSKYIVQVSRHRAN